MALWKFPDRVRNVMAETLTHHWTEMLQFKRAAFLKSMGMDEDQQVTRFPPSSTTIEAKSGIGPAIVAAGATLAGLAGGAYLMGGFRGNETPAAAVAPVQTPDIPQPKITVEDQAARVILYYDDPVKGLVPIAGAADQDGAKLNP